MNAPLPEPLPLGPPPAPRIRGDDSKFSYTYLEVGGLVLDVDETSEDVDIWYGRASLGLFGLFFGSVTYETQEFDTFDTDADVLSLGVGAHLSLTPSMDVVGEVAWLYSDVSSDDDDFDGTENGTEISAGIRWMPFDWGGGGGLELNGGALWQDLDNRLASDESVVGWQLGVRAHLIQLVSVGANYTLLEDDDQLGLNVRVSF
jgi:hypothetical protein